MSGRLLNTLICSTWLLALITAAAVGQTPTAKPPQQGIPAGVVVARQACAAKPDQSYAVYLPSHYPGDKRWPILYAFDPDGRGNVPVELMKDAAERFGYIVVGSNNSRNGSWKLEAESAQAMWDDTHARLAIDDGRVYFAGFSGGARLASQLARQCKCAAGVLLSGAGFAGTPPSRDAVFAVFAVVGTLDFNYPELSDLDDKLEQAGFPHVLRHFDGSHEWPPSNVMEEALAWFRLMAMKQNREARDLSFIAAQKAAALASAQSLEQAGQPYDAWRQYRQAAATFDGLTDTAVLQQAAAALAQQKAVHDGEKRETQEFQEQHKLTGQIYSGLSSLPSNAGGRSDPVPQPDQPAGTTRERGTSAAPPTQSLTRADIFHQTEQQILDLRERTESEKHADKVRVYRRALAGVFIAAGEFGDESFDSKNFSLAKDYYQLATDAYPDSVGALKELATARALNGDSKGALEALRRGKEKSKDPAAFSTWLKEEPAFAKLREDPRFRTLLASP